MRVIRLLAFGIAVGISIGMFTWQQVHAVPAAQKTQTATPEGVPTQTSRTATASDDLIPVVRDIDGDTIVVFYQGVTTTIRLIGVDTPETVDPKKPAECFGEEASQETKSLVNGAQVRLEFDPSQGMKDVYGRTLAYVYLADGTLLDKFLIAQGYGHEYTYKTPYEYQSEFKVAQASAKTDQLGLWSPSTCNGKTGVGSKPLSS